MITRNLGGGVWGTVVWAADSTLWVVLREDPRAGSNLLKVGRFTAGLDPVGSVQSVVLGPDTTAYPRATVLSDGRRVVVFKGGAPNYAAVVMDLETGATAEIAQRVDGAKPLAVGADCVAWQHLRRVGDGAVYDVYRRSLVTGLPAEWVRYGSPTGLDRILPDLSVVLDDEARFSIPYGTAPGYANKNAMPLVESIDGGLLSTPWPGDSRWLSLWAGEDTRDPQVAASPDNQYLAAITWGTTGVRLAVFTDADLGLPHVAPIRRPQWVGGFFEYHAQYGSSPAPLGNCTFVSDLYGVTSPPAAVALIPDWRLLRDVDAATELRIRWDRVAAVMVLSGEGTPTADSVDGQALAALEEMRLLRLPRRPLIGYVDAPKPDRWPANVEIVAPQLYPLPGESLRQSVIRFQERLDELRGRRVIKIWRADDSNGTQPDTLQTAALQFWAPRLAAVYPNDEGTLFFADRRGNGIARTPVLRGPIEAFGRSVATPPIETISEGPGELPPFAISMTYFPDEGEAPLWVVAQGYVTSGGEAIREWTWWTALPGRDFVQAGLTTGAVFTFTYRFVGPGLFRLKLVATSVSGRVAETGTVRLVTVRQPDSEVPPMDQAAYLKRLQTVNQFYLDNPANPERKPADQVWPNDGLGRPGGMVRDEGGVPTADVEAQAQWGYQILVNNKSDAWVRNQIRGSQEWRDKYPGQTPRMEAEGNPS